MVNKSLLVTLKGIVILLVLFLLLFVYISGFENAFIDDAFIVLKYSQNLKQSGSWGFFAERTTNTVTTPLKVVLLALGDLLVNNMLQTVKWLLIFEFLFLFVFLNLLSQRWFGNYCFGFMVFLAFLFNPLLVSTLGVGGVLFALLMIITLYAFVSGYLFFLSLVLALLTLARPEGFLFLLVLICFISNWEKKFKLLAWYLCFLSPWLLFSWIKLGSLFPDTLLIKINDLSFQKWKFFNGIFLYFYAYPRQMFFSLFWVLVAVFGMRKRFGDFKKIYALIVFSAVHFIGYAFLKVPPYHWYYVPELVSIIFGGALAGYLAYEKLKEKKSIKSCWILIFLLIFPAIGIAFEFFRQGYPLKEMPVHTNCATFNQYKEIGLWIKENVEPETIIVLKGTEIGVLAFLSERYLLNVFSERYWLKKYADSGNFLVKLNYRWLKLDSPLTCKTPLSLIALRAGREIADSRVEIIKSWDISSKWISQVNKLVLVREKRD